MEAIYFNTFDEYEKNLELVKTEIQESQPSWLHYWFYRYLQISPYYWAIHLKQSKSKEDQERYIRIQKFNNDWERIPDVKNDIGIKILSPEKPQMLFLYLSIYFYQALLFHSVKIMSAKVPTLLSCNLW